MHNHVHVHVTLRHERRNKHARRRDRELPAPALLQDFCAIRCALCLCRCARSSCIALSRDFSRGSPWLAPKCRHRSRTQFCGVRESTSAAALRFPCAPCCSRVAGSPSSSLPCAVFGSLRLGLRRPLSHFDSVSHPRLLSMSSSISRLAHMADARDACDACPLAGDCRRLCALSPSRRRTDRWPQKLGLKRIT